MKSSSRRIFIAGGLGAASALLLGRQTLAADAPPALVPETDPTAQALGYKADAARVDKAKFAKYQPGQHCAICQFYQGKPADAAAACTMFGNRPVAGPGWCSAYMKKA
jgi:hypothetical protein